MKIQDAFKQNKEYWEEQVKNLTIRLGAYQGEVQKIAAQLNEAKQQIDLYGQAEKFVLALEPEKAKVIDNIKAEIAVDAIDITPVKQ